jgi:hypothetical protein
MAIVSIKTQQVGHRQRWPDGGEVFDATIEIPITIRNPDKPIGTHVFTAMARDDAGPS